MNALNKLRRFIPPLSRIANMCEAGQPGSGAGRGGGSGGSIRDAGGAFGKMQVAREEEYFYKKQKEQLGKLKNEKISQKEFHEEQIKAHEEALKRHKEFLSNLK